MKGLESMKYFFQAISVPRIIRAEGPDAVRYYHSLEAPELIKGNRKAVRLYREARTILNTPRARMSLQLRMAARFAGGGR